MQPLCLAVVFITLSYQFSCGVVHPCGCNFPFLLILTATHDHGTVKTRQIGYAAQALVANQSTIIFEPHSEKQSSPRTLLTVLGLGGLKSHRPLSYHMHSSLGYIASLTGSCGILFSGCSSSNAVVLSPHLPQLKKEKYSPHQPKGGISDVIASFRL